MSSLLTLVNSLVNFYVILIVIWCFLSWIPRQEGGLISDVSEVLDRLVSPYISLFSRFIPPIGGLNWSPVVAVLVLEALQNILARMLY